MITPYYVIELDFQLIHFIILLTSYQATFEHHTTMLELQSMCERFSSSKLHPT